MVSALIHQLTGLGSILRVVIANKSISTGAVVLIHRNLERLDWTKQLRIKLAKYFVELCRSHILWNFTNKDIAALIRLCEVSAKQRVVKRKTTAALHDLVAFFVHPSDLEIAEEVSSFLEDLFILDTHDARVERLCWVSPHLRLVLELYVSFFEQLC
jgi:hypothetical protein